MSNAYDFEVPKLDWETDETDEERALRIQRSIEETIAEDKALKESDRGDATDMGNPDTVVDSAIQQYLNIAKAKADFFQPVTNVIRGALGGIAQTPWAVGAGVAAIPGLINQAIGPTNQISARGTRAPAPAEQDMLGTASYLSRQGIGADEAIASLLGSPPKEKETGMQQAERIIGQSIMPAKTLAAIPATALASAVQYFAEERQKAVDAARSKQEDIKAKALTGLPENQGGLPDWVSNAIISPAAAYPSQFDQAGKVIRPAIRPESENTQFWTLGAMAAGTLAMMVAPRLYHTFATTPLPKFRPVADSPPGTMAMSNVWDLANTYHDVNSPLLRMAERQGATPAEMEQLDRVFGLQTRMAAQSMADSAVMGGRIEGVNHRFNTPVPLAEIARMDNPEFSQYAHLWDTADDLNRLQTPSQYRGQPPAPGTTTVRGMTMNDVTSQIAQMEAANPELRPLHAQYKRFMKDVREFEASGEYSTITKQERNDWNQYNANEVPMYGQRQYGQDFDRGLATNAAADNVKDRIRARLENEAKGVYVDMIRRRNPQMFTPVSAEELSNNPRWRRNVVSFYRRGELERYVTDPFIADVMKMDPYYFQGMAGNAMFAAKRLVEIGATGFLAPWFAPTSFLRNYQLGKLSDTRGLRGAGIIRSLTAIPQQLYPQLARAISTSLDRGSGGWLTQVLGGQANRDRLAMTLAQHYERSLYAQLQSVGSHKGSILEQQQFAFQRLQRAIDNASGTTKAIYEGYRNLLNAVHNAPAFAFARKNYARVPLSELALEARRLTGDPRTGGQYYTSRGRPIRFEDPNARVSHTLVRGLGVLSEIGRTSIPWYNATIQGMKRVGQAYLDNPVGFVGRAWLYAGMPSAATYLLAHSAGTDPNGMKYTDYMINRRSDYKKTMNYYVPIPGRPAEQGIEIPRVHELAIVNRLMESAMHHIFGGGHAFNEKQDAIRALQSVLDIAVMPPTPSLWGLALASAGYQSSGNPFTGEVYKRREEPYDSRTGVPLGMELMMRAMATGIGEVAGSGLAAFTQTPDGLANATKNFFKEAGTRAASRTPILRDITQTYPPAAGSTNITDELFKKNKAINDLTSFYNNWGMTGDKPIHVDTKERPGLLAAQERMQASDHVLKGAPVPEERVGLSQRPPNNPLYLEFMKEVYNRFKQDNPGPPSIDLKGPVAQMRKEGAPKSEVDKFIRDNLDVVGGTGFQSLWKYYGDASAHLRDLQKVNAGNNVTWQQQLQNRPEQLKLLQDNNVDTKDIIAVRNFYERVRQDTGRTILNTIRAVEDELSKRIGRKVEIQDIKPYLSSGQGIVFDEALQSSIP